MKAAKGRWWGSEPSFNQLPSFSSERRARRPRSWRPKICNQHCGMVYMLTDEFVYGSPQSPDRS